jgi:2,4-dienoyl-CoA reductase-like NADH-dependent reductase (Old Yellow Enzyme family)
MSALFSPLTFRNLTLRNRIGVSPMCQYSSEDGFATDWHMAHIGARAMGGAGLIIMEATGVAPEGRITPACLGIWDDAHIPQLQKIAAFAKSQGAAIGIQLAHAGRKASMDLPWRGGKQLDVAEGGWETLAPSPVPFAAGQRAPREMTEDDIADVKKKFVGAALRAVKAGFQVLELHGAHGYLLHEFLSPLSNMRTDGYGGTAENRRRLIVEIAAAVRAAVPGDIVVGARLSCIDWLPGGITVADSVETAKALKAVGVDFIDCSSGAIASGERIKTEPGYQLPFARDVRKGANVPVAAVGMITHAKQAEEIIASGDADMVFIARAFLNDPYFPLHAAQELGVEAPVPMQYARGF